MAKSDLNEIWLSPAPHFSMPVTTRRIMLLVIICLLPLCVSGIIFFGVPALITILVSVVCCVGFEACFRLITKQQPRVTDFSAAVTGLLLALTLPPATPVWMTILGALFAVVVAKEFFGGLGANVFNPALAGRAFLMLSFPAALSSWTVPFDGVSGPTPLSILQGEGGMQGLADTLGNGSAGELYLNLFLGSRGGTIGETCVMLILLAFIVLVITRIIDWRAPVAMVVTTVAICWIAGTDPLITALTGGLLFGAVFMTTDYATSPVTKTGRLLFGFGCGLITGIIRLFGGFPEGVMFSILIMNSLVPFLNKIIARKYGFVPVKKEQAT
ncbi:MAG: RnfABCDGE type electron transport complex subunit D [Spirochaetaceae bacterium]|nr:RnfABCDGE type electron transport complex subunit D [Spirochaetaceae bacterium]